MSKQHLVSAHPLPSICGLEGLPGTGKSTLCLKLPIDNVSNYAGSDVGPSRYPWLKRDTTGRHTLSLKSVWRNNRFFLQREVARTDALEKRGINWAVLDRTWISGIVFNYAIAKACSIPKGILAHYIDSIESAQATGLLYFPDWLLIFKIPEKESFRRVVLRDSRFFSDNMLQIFTREQRISFLRFRAEGYKLIEKTAGLPIINISYRAPIETKCDAAITLPEGTRFRDPVIFFRTLRKNMLNGK
ncbi:MAG: hypothetical protein WCI64_05855 [Chlorobium sp.]